MDIDALLELINETRETTYRLDLNSGKHLDLPPNVKAFEYGTDMLMLVWQGEEPMKVNKATFISAVNVASLKTYKLEDA